jgi:hypothetical protein
MIVIKRLWQTKKQRKKIHQVLALEWSTSAYQKGCDNFMIEFYPNRRPTFLQVRLRTVDNYQGEEAKVSI